MDIKDDEMLCHLYFCDASCAHEKIPTYLTWLDEMYLKLMGPLDPDTSEGIRLKFMTMIGLDVAPLPQRKQVKAKRKVVDKK
jgi:hypothetical protein